MFIDQRSNCYYHNLSLDLALFLFHGHLDCFQFLAIMNNVAVSIWIYAGLYAKYMFNFLRNCLPVFQSY